VCPLRGQSLESRLAAQRGVVRAISPGDQWEITGSVAAGLVFVAAALGLGVYESRVTSPIPGSRWYWLFAVPIVVARSIQCCADADWREMSEETMPLVGLPQSRSIRARGPVQRGSKRVAPRRQGSAFSAQPAAPCSAGFSLR
jgi:hypothetical protein